MEHPGLLGHTYGVCIGLLSSKTPRCQALVVDSRLRPKATDNRSSTERIRIEKFSEPEPKRGKAVWHWNTTSLHNTIHTACSALLLSTRTNLVIISLCNGQLKAVDSEWKQTLWPVGCAIFQCPTAFIRALGKEDNHNNLHAIIS